MVYFLHQRPSRRVNFFTEFPFVTAVPKHQTLQTVSHNYANFKRYSGQTEHSVMLQGLLLLLNSMLCIAVSGIQYDNNVKSCTALHSRVHTLTRTHTLSHTFTFTLTLTHTHTRAHPLTHIHTHALTHTHTQSLARTPSHAHSRSHTQSLTRTYTLSHTFTRTPTHTHIRAHTNTMSQAPPTSSLHTK
jgi:hypothetical protein